MEHPLLLFFPFPIFSEDPYFLSLLISKKIRKIFFTQYEILIYLKMIYLRHSVRTTLDTSWTILQGNNIMPAPWPLRWENALKLQLDMMLQKAIHERFLLINTGAGFTLGVRRAWSTMLKNRKLSWENSKDNNCRRHCSAPKSHPMVQAHGMGLGFLFIILLNLVVKYLHASQPLLERLSFELLKARQWLFFCSCSNRKTFYDIWYLFKHICAWLMIFRTDF